LSASLKFLNLQTLFLASGIIQNINRSGSTEFIIETEREIVKNLERKFSNKKKMSYFREGFLL